jgi:hypothetical protein
MLYLLAEALPATSTGTWVIAICALANILIAFSQMMVIPFVRGVRSDVKELTTTIIAHQLTLKEVQLIQTNSERSRLQTEDRIHQLNNRLNDVMLHLASKGIYIPPSIKAEQARGGS